jgi:DNA-binding transcriptional MerR regulator
MLMTTTEMVERACVRPIDRPPFLARIQHWAATGLIKPTGEHRPGSGRHRRFDDRALEDVLLLTRLADFGIPIGVQETALILVRDARKHWHREDWRGKVAKGQRLILEVARLPGGQLVPHYHEGTTYLANNTAECAIVFDLGKIFSVLVPPAELTLSRDAPDVKITA